MQKLLMFAPVLLVLFIQGLLPTELPPAARPFSWRGRDDLGWAIWRGAQWGSRDITGTSVRVGFMLGKCSLL